MDQSRTPLPVFTPITGAIRALTMDAIEQAKSGHPGAPMGMAEIAEVLWRSFLKHNPANPQWVDRDRFVLSNGHGSMLLYALLHLSGYELPITEIKRFRQLHSKTPGHPEYGYTPGVETTTGPLGQGIANAVGMALSEKLLAQQFNRPGFSLLDHYTYAFVGDGCLMEGISHEACSLAGSWGLGKLIVFYDDNGISIDGPVHDWFSDDTPMRFEAYGWQVIRDVAGHDPVAITEALRCARANSNQASLICCKTIIGAGAPNKQGECGIHGAPLGAAEIEASRSQIDWPHAPFEIPPHIYALWDAKEQGQKAEAQWQELWAAYQLEHPDLAAEFQRRVVTAQLPENWDSFVGALVSQIDSKQESLATRKASQNCIEAFASKLPEIIGGSADLAASNLTLWSGSKGVRRTGEGNYLYYGVREFGMAAIANGIALHGGLIPYTATFLMFSEYARNALRMAALMKVRQIFVFTHDSIGLGEDGPTHQPIEQTASLRLIPNMDVWRPCDTVETAVAWAQAIGRHDGPSSLLFSRQTLPFQARTSAQIAAIHRGAYVLAESAAQLNAGKPQLVIIATGSEVSLAMAAQQALLEANIATRVVSMPSTNVFDRQDSAWRQQVLPPGIPRLAVEAGVSDGWYKYVGFEGAVIGIDRFGESAPAGELFDYFGLNCESIVAAARRLLA